MSSEKRPVCKYLLRAFVPVACLAGIFLFSTLEATKAGTLYSEDEMHSPLEIVDVSVDKPPAVGVPFEMRVRMAWIPPLENFTLAINTPGAIQI